MLVVKIFVLGERYYVRPSVVVAPYREGWTFRQYFCTALPRDSDSLY